MKSNDVRRKFLEFFRDRGHAILASSPVVPHGDRTLLFTNAGMVQFKDYFTGRERPPSPRATTVQKCIRAGGKHNDLENVGETKRHLTFFEMLGNFSFGDYFKREAIRFAWDLVTEDFGLEPERLWVTVYREDDEARDLWAQISGLPASRIVGMGEKDNYWSMGDVGPCGPCSEILLDRGEAFGAADLENGERFFEIWNLVFMQFNQGSDGKKTPLPRPSIDTGMGLERIAMVMQGVDSVYDTDVLRAIISRVEEISGVEYRAEAWNEGIPHRVVADHIRSLVFSLADGAELSNEGRGYVVRRILRRAARYGRKIYQGGLLLHRLVPTVVAEMGESYPEIRQHEEFITRQIESEEERFGRTLDRGIEIFNKEAERLESKGEKTIPGAVIFKLYDTFGFPVDLVERMALESGLRVDLAGFDEDMKRQKEGSRKGSTFDAAVADVGGDGLRDLPPTTFLGYENTCAEAELQGAAGTDDGLRLVLSQTPFYAEGGGQVGDTGLIEGDDFRFKVEDTQRDGDRFIHIGRLEEGDPGALKAGSVVRARVDEDRRSAIERNHSATHLLHAALRQVLGTHVHQKGSLVAPARLRFDVTHFHAIAPEELGRAEDLVRREILANTPVEVCEMERDEAIARGAMAFFGEKYGERVRVVKMGDFSMELCGGTHVDATGEVGPFVVVGEGSVSSGVRRLEALTAADVDRLYRSQTQLIEDLARRLKVAPDRLEERIEKLLEENRELKAKRAKAAGAARDGNVKRREIGDLEFASGVYDDLDGKALLECFDALKKKSKRLVAAFFSRRGGKVQVLVAVTPALAKEGWDARELFRVAGDVIGARGGGRPQMVQAGGGDPAKIEAAIGAIEAALEAKLAG